MSRTTNQSITQANQFLLHFEHSPNLDFSLWKEFSVKALTLYESEFSGVRKVIEDFDAEHSGKIEFDDRGNALMIDGWDVHEDKVLSLDSQHSKILPIMFVGAFNDFERCLKDLVAEIFEGLMGIYDAEKIERAKNKMAQRGKFKYIADVEKLLHESELISITFSSLSENWNAINNYRELRNLFAHNDNPIDVQKDMERILKVSQINGVDITDGNFVSLNDVSVIIRACDHYEEFMRRLIEEISQKIVS